MRLRLGLYPKLTFVFVLFAALLLLAVEVLVYASGRTALHAAAISELLATATEKQHALNNLVEEHQEDIVALAAAPQLREQVAVLTQAALDTSSGRAAHDALVQQLRAQVAARPELAALFVLAPTSGQIIASTNAVEEGQFREDQPYFINGRQAPFVQNPEYSLKTQMFRMTVGVPLRSADGKLLGVLAGESKMNEVNAIITQRTGLHQSDDAFLVNASNFFVTQPRLLPEAAVLRRGIHTAAVQSCLAHSNGVITALDYRNVPVIVDYTWLADRQLCLIVKLDQAEAFAPIRDFAVALASMSGLALLAAFLLALGLARAIAQPVLTLQKAAVQLGRGQWEHPVEVDTGDELSQLARTFNEMAAGLRRSHAELEQRVQERTAALRESEQRWATTLASIGDAVIATDTASRITFMNAAAESLTGWPFAEVEQKPVPSVFNIINGHTRQAVDDPVTNVLETKAIVGLANPALLIRRDGTEVAIDDRGAPIKGEDGQIRGVVLIFRDISERRQAEQLIRDQTEQLQAQNEELTAQQEELIQARDELEERVRERTGALEKANRVLEAEIEERKRAEAQVRQNAQRTSALAEISQALAAAGPNYLATLDQIARTISVFIGDACIIRLLSENRQHLEPAAFYHADPAACETMRAILAVGAHGISEGIAGRVYQTKEPVFMPAALAEDLHRQVRPSVLLFLNQVHVAGLIEVPLLIQAEVLGTLGIFRLTAEHPYTAEDLKLLQSLADRVALAIANARLYQDLENALAQEKAMRQELIQAEKLSAMGRVVASVAHELNNPLQTITNCLYLTEGDLPSASPIHQYVEMASSETRRLTRLVAQLREVYRPRLAGQPEPLNLLRLLADVHGLLGPQLERHHVQWQLTAHVAEVDVSGIADQLKQVFINLGQNAAEAMQPAGGSLTVEVTVTASADAPQVEVAFRDTGPGIAPENLDRLFEPFYTTKPTGLGLGLSICNDIIQRHGGRIAVESQLGAGTVFTVRLPLDRGAEPYMN